MSEDIRQIRLDKLARLRELGFDPYSVERWEKPYSAQDLLDRFQELAPQTEEGQDHPSEQEQKAKTLSFAGRLVSLRIMGKAAFAHISDGDAKIQGYFRRDDLPEGQWEAFKLLDIGDHVGVHGYLFTTRTGEKSLHITDFHPLSKSLHVLPLGKEAEDEEGNRKSWYGLSDVDQRYRHRHLDLVTNPEAREMLLNRSRIVRAVRNFFDSRGYFEVETPLLQLEAGGAAARPFLTHYNAYDLDVKLRISLELYLKRIICGDVPKVYEIGRVFRNEGVSNRHNPEFTLLEWYEAYTNLEGMMECVESLFANVSAEVFGTTVVQLSNNSQDTVGYNYEWISGTTSISRVPKTDHPLFVSQMSGQTVIRKEDGETIVFESKSYSVFQGDSQQYYYVKFDEPGIVRTLLEDSENTNNDGLKLDPGVYVFAPIIPSGKKQGKTLDQIDFSKPWHRLDLLTAIQDRSGIVPEELNDLESAKKAMARVGLPTEKENNLGGIIEKLLEHFVEPHLQEPTFIVGYPIETSPLAKKDPARPGFTRRFEGYVLGREICNAFSEINDPIDQRERFEQQTAERAKGDDEAHPMDEDFIYALESGMPPTGGCGIGIDRLVMLLTGADHLREILLFPMMRPEKKQEETD